MNDILKAIKSRRSIRSYLDREVPRELVEDVLEAARFAPSALNKQPWEFVVISDKALIAEMSCSIRASIRRIYAVTPLLKLLGVIDDKWIAALKKTATSEEDTVFYGAPLLILIVSNQKNKWAGIDCSIAAENMMLAAHSLGLGSCFIGRGRFLRSDKRLFEKVGLKKGYKIYATLSFGYPKELPKNTPERRKDNILSWKQG